MSEHEHALPTGPFGYGVCEDCGTAVQRRVLARGHECDPERYAARQAARLHWPRSGFDAALGAWLDTPAGRFAQFDARRRVAGAPPPARPGDAA
jgi:hypothetical protein